MSNPSIRQAVAAISTGEQSAAEYVAQIIDAAREKESFGALLSLDVEAIEQQAVNIDRKREQGERLGPLAGIPFVIKDNIDAVGWPTTCCTPALADNAPAVDAESVAALRAADAIVLGKAVLHELAMGGTSNNPQLPPVLNPAAPGHIPGGSSGGTAVAIAAGFAPFGLGSDTGGSIPIPAALCGIAGLRPTMGRYSQHGLVAANPTRDTVGPMARHADELRLIDAAMTGTREVTPPASNDIRLGVADMFWQGLDAPVEHVMTSARAALEAAGVELVAVDLSEVAELSELVATGLRIEPSFHLAQALAALPGAPSIEDVAAASASPEIAQALRVTARGRGNRETLDRARDEHRPRLQAAFARAFQQSGIDALLLPTTPLAAATLDVQDTVMINGETHDIFVYTRHTLPIANAGLPFLSIPAGHTAAGLPVGAGLVGPAGSDAELLAVGTTCQNLLAAV